MSVMSLLPQQLSLALQAVQELDLAVHVHDLILKVLSGDVNLLAELSEYTRQLPEVQNNDNNSVWLPFNVSSQYDVLFFTVFESLVKVMIIV